MDNLAIAVQAALRLQLNSCARLLEPHGTSGQSASREIVPTRLEFDHPRSVGGDPIWNRSIGAKFNSRRWPWMSKAG
jgi:hypothetical protein